MAAENRAETTRAGETDRIRVLIADDHVLFRRALRVLLLDVEDVEVVGEVGDGREAVAETERLRPDVVLMDVVMPVMDGAQATAAILAGRSQPRVLALSGSGVEARIFATLRAGAVGYVSKSSPEDTLVEAIRQVHRGRVSMPQEITLRLLEKYKPAAPEPESLTQRETEILLLVAKGLSNQEIASRLHLSAGTIRNHLSNIFLKLNVGNRVEASLCALRDGLTTLDECLEPAVRHAPP